MAKWIVIFFCGILFLFLAEVCTHGFVPFFAEAKLLVNIRPGLGVCMSSRDDMTSRVCADPTWIPDWTTAPCGTTDRGLC